MIAVTALYAPTILLLSYFLDASQVGIALLFLSIINIVFLKINNSHIKNYLLSIIIFICSIVAFISRELDSLFFVPLIISISFLLLFIFYSLKKKSIPLEATIKFRKKELTESSKAFLFASHDWWLLPLSINVALHIYFIALDNMLLWTAYASFGWYILFAVSIAINVIIGKLVVQKNSL